MHSDLVILPPDQRNRVRASFTRRLQRERLRRMALCAAAEDFETCNLDGQLHCGGDMWKPVVLRVLVHVVADFQYPFFLHVSSPENLTYQQPPGESVNK